LLVDIVLGIGDRRVPVHRHWPGRHHWLQSLQYVGCRHWRRGRALAVSHRR
jgi:hypothetical protein